MLAEDDFAMAIRTEEKKAEQLAALKKVRDSASSVILNLIWWRRWRLHDHMRVYASRDGVRSTQEMELYALENEADSSEVIEDLSDDEGYASSVLSDDRRRT